MNQVYNVAVGERTTLNDLYAALRRQLAPRFPHLANAAAGISRIPRRRRAPQSGGHR